MKVEVRPIVRNRWHGKKGKESLVNRKVIKPFIDPNTQQYVTGLTSEDIENYKKLGVKYDLSPQMLHGQPHPFWDSSTIKIKLEDFPMFFDDGNILDSIKIKILKASKFVANSMRDFEESKYPEATHVICNELEEVEEKARKIEVIKQAYIKSNSLSKSKKLQIVLILSGKNLKDKSDSFLSVEYSKLIESNPAELLRQIGRDKEDLTLESMVLEALQKNVLVKEGHKIKYFDSILGNDIDEVVKYFKDVENQSLKLKIMESLL